MAPTRPQRMLKAHLNHRKRNGHEDPAGEVGGHLTATREQGNRPEAKRSGHGRKNMGELLTPTHPMVVLFGGNKLPELRKGLGAELVDDIASPRKPAQTVVPN